MYTDKLKRLMKFIFWEHLGFTAVFTYSAYLRYWFLNWWSTYPFGDIYNFITIARGLPDGVYPTDEKRLPFYPLLILITHTLAKGISWENAAIFVAIAMSLLVLVLFYALGRKLGVSKIALIIGALLLSAYPPFLGYSIRGYADTTFIALTLAALLTALSFDHRKRYSVILGALLGMLSLTRYEGVIVSIFILAFIFVTNLTRWKRTLTTIGILVITVSPYAIIALANGRSLGPQSYLNQAKQEDQGYGSDSLEDFRDKYVEILERTGFLSIWYTPAKLMGTLRSDLLGFHNELAARFTIAPYVTADLAFVGIVFFLLRRRLKKTLLFLGTALVIIIPIAWWAPYVRYDAFVFPFVALFAAGGLHAFLSLLNKSTNGKGGKILTYFVKILLLIVAVGVWFGGMTHNAYDSLRKSRGRDYALYQAVLEIKKIGEPVLFEDYMRNVELTLGNQAIFVENKKNNLEDPVVLSRYFNQSKVPYAVATSINGSESDMLKGLKKLNLEPIKSFEIEQGDKDIRGAYIFKIN